MSGIVENGRENTRKVAGQHSSARGHEHVASLL